LDNEVSRNFYLPLSVQASEELEAVQLLLQNSDWDPEVWDIWSYNWNSMNFSSKKAYKFLQGTQEASPLFLGFGLLATKENTIFSFGSSRTA
jgi:hypothetical protein